MHLLHKFAWTNKNIAEYIPPTPHTQAKPLALTETPQVLAPGSWHWCCTTPVPSHEEHWRNKPTDASHFNGRSPDEPATSPSFSPRQQPSRSSVFPNHQTTFHNVHTIDRQRPRDCIERKRERRSKKMSPNRRSAPILVANLKFVRYGKSSCKESRTRGVETKWILLHWHKMTFNPSTLLGLKECSNSCRDLFHPILARGSQKQHGEDKPIKNIQM